MSHIHVFLTQHDCCSIVWSYNRNDRRAIENLIGKCNFLSTFIILKVVCNVLNESFYICFNKYRPIIDITIYYYWRNRTLANLKTSSYVWKFEMKFFYLVEYI